MFHRRGRRFRLGGRSAGVAAFMLVVLGTTVLADGITSPTPASAGAWDTSSAIRYDADGTVIGTAVESLIDNDDGDWLVPSSPFPVNFFGTKYAQMCVTTNGSVYPSNGTCTDQYDEGMGQLAISGAAPLIAALATDIDPGEASLMIENENGAIPSGPVTGTSGAAGSVGPRTLTVTSSASLSDLVVGDWVYFWGTGDSRLDDYKYLITALDTTARTMSFSVGGVVPDGIAQGKWYYHRTVTFGAYSGMVASTTPGDMTVTSTVSDGLGLKVGDSVAFQSADANIDAKIYEVSAVGSGTFDFVLPAGAPAPVTTTPGYWFFSDGVGAVRTVNYGTATIDGRSAMVFTWYRIAENDTDNQDWLYNTLQIVIVQRSTGDATNGWDFDIEFNYGSLQDDEDGYDATDPTDSCTAYTNPGIVNGIADCRWGVGAASYKSGLQVQSISFSGTDATITTTTPHGLAGLGSEVWIKLDTAVDPVINNLTANDRGRATVTGASTLTFPVDTPGADTTFTPPPAIEASDVYELYADYSIDRLADNGDTAMVDNSVNSSVLGRYTFGFVGGTPSGFKTLAEAISPSPAPAPAVPPAAAAPAPVTTPSASATTTPTPAPAVPPLEPVVSVITSTVLPGQGLILENGATVPVTVRPNGSSSGIVMEGPGFALNLAGQQANGSPAPLNSRGQLVVNSEQGLSVSGTGFAPGTDAQVYVLTGSEQRAASRSGMNRAGSTAALQLGAAKVGANGEFTGVLPIPSTLTPGEYVAQVVGYSPSFQVRVASLGMVLTKPAVPVKRLRTTVLFAPLSAVLTDASVAKLSAAVKKVPKRVSKVTVQVVGYVQPTSGTGNDRTLSTARAKAVAAELKALGIKGQFVVSGRGQATQSGAAARRVEVVIAYQKR